LRPATNRSRQTDSSIRQQRDGDQQLPIDLKRGVRIGIEPPKNVQCPAWKRSNAIVRAHMVAPNAKNAESQRCRRNFCRGAELGSLPLIVMTLAGTISASRSEPVAEFDEDVAIRRAVRDAKECLIATNAD
jgi:hypothetical protein